jgi:pimeloyl-ACP methyl ester carboxylesterase
VSDDAAGVSVRGGRIDAQTDDIRTLAHVIDRTGTELLEHVVALHGQLLDVRAGACALADPVGFTWFETRLGFALEAPGGLATLAAACTASAFVRAGGITHPAAAAAGALGAFVAADPAAVDAVAREVRRQPWSRAADLLLGAGDGTPVVTEGGTDPSEAAATPPHGVADLMSGLSRRNEEHGGDIDVRILYRPDGSRAAVVDIPGTKTWTTGGTDVADLTTNCRAIAGRETAYERGVLLAMERAGITPDVPVLLIGHSEGGMVAVNAALHADGRFRITHVVTAGAPVGDTVGAVPRDVRVLAVENEHDAVPHLDDRANPAKLNVLTATVHHDHGSPGSNHELEGSYVPGARDIDASDDPAIRVWLDSARPFLDATGVETRRYSITRGS